MGLKREIILLAVEKGIQDLYHMTDICLVGIHCLKGFPKRARRLDECERLGNAFLDAVKHLSDNGMVGDTLVYQS